MNLKMIAKRAGVSAVTVSNVINGKHHKVSRETIERVQQIIRETGYQPNATARSLIKKQSRIIGVVIPHVERDQPASLSPYNSQMMALLECEIRQRGYYQMSCCVPRCKDAVPSIATWNVDGAVILGAFEDDVEELHKLLNIPAVYLDAYLHARSVHTVCVDDEQGGYLAARHLIERGHRSIAFVAPAYTAESVICHRYRGFVRAFQERNLPLPEDHYFTADTLFESGIAAGRMIAEKENTFTGIVTAADVVAFGVIEGLRACGKRVPEDVSVIGFDDIPACRYTYPQLTTVSQHMEEKARRAVELLFSLIEPDEPGPDSRTVPVELIERGTVRRIRE